MKPESHIMLRTINRYYFLAAAMSASIFVLSFINVWLCLGLSGVMFATFLFPELTIRYVMRGKQAGVEI
jgi:ABC-type transport system involved in cytochrome bd biosynthesis fused ATPase/permease subunit